MQFLRWKIRNVAGGVVVLLIAYFWLYPRKYSYTESTTLHDVQPHEAWEYVADFSNMLQLNPTISEFAILSDSGNYEHWQYVVEYVENLSHWPYLRNVGVGDFSVHSNFRRKSYYINSSHVTCFMRPFCLHSDSDFQFSLADGEGVNTHCQETVRYQCLPVLHSFCHREVVHQRQAIMRNLHKHFVDRKRV